MRITFHIGKYTVTIIVYERKKKQPPLWQVTDALGNTKES